MNDKIWDVILFIIIVLMILATLNAFFGDFNGDSELSYDEFEVYK